MKILRHEIIHRVEERLHRIYGDTGELMVERFCMLLGRYGVGKVSPRRHGLWTENDVVLISYADTIRDEESRPLEVLRQFCTRRLKNTVRRIHLLPFFPWSSDDGFSVIDYRQVGGQYGRWEDIERLGDDFGLMFDLVLNHCSMESSWFREFVIGIAPGRHYFLPVDPNVDLSSVVRPRPWPLLTKTATRGGDVWVWTTFSEDQVDLNWQNPDVLFEFLDILLWYLSKGATMLRLDAVAFLWKEIGTTCLHRPETHEIIKLFRDTIEIVAPDTLIVTETNVPHEENISYFGDGDEAHMVYNFTLPPLLLYCLLREDASSLREWAVTLPDLPRGRSFLNFTASHDGIGVRPLQGILPDAEIAWLVEQTRERGGRVSMKRNSDGSESPYELNITYVDALKAADDPELSRRRFLCSQAIVLALRGVPAVYIHSILGTPNHIEGVEGPGGYNRAINRRKYRKDELDRILDDADHPQGAIFATYTRWLRRRNNHPAFHPEAGQEILDLGPHLFGLVRTGLRQDETIVCVFNVTACERRIRYSKLHPHFERNGTARELLSAETIRTGPNRSLVLPPYHAVWLALR